jgi:hypothetical protein
MTERRPNRASGRTWWRSVWVRAGFLHPAAFVGPWVGLSLLLAARAGSEINDVAWAFWVIPLSAVASFVTTVVMAVRQSVTATEGIAIVIVGLIASATALVLGFIGWLQAAEVACHGGYECPL